MVLTVEEVVEHARTALFLTMLMEGVCLGLAATVEGLVSPSAAHFFFLHLLQMTLFSTFPFLRDSWMAEVARLFTCVSVLWLALILHRFMVSAFQLFV